MLRHLVQTLGIGLQPTGRNRRQRQCKGEGDRRGAHGGEVAGSDRQRTLTKEKGVANVGEMHPGDQGIGRNRQLLTGG
ncbi:hypothetical protein D3C86_2181580 [compost metagenome]